MTNDDVIVYCYRSPIGLNLYDEYASTHEHVTMMNLNTDVCQGFTVLDIDSNPAIANTYTSDPTVDGSIFQFNTTQKSTVTLKCWLHFSDARDYNLRKQMITDYFTQKACYQLSTNYNKTLIANCYLNKLEIPFPQNRQHDILFDIVFDNPRGTWDSSTTAWMQKHMQDRDKSFAQDLALPLSETGKITGADWTLRLGTNSIFNAGSTTIKMSSATDYMQFNITGSSGDVSIINKDKQGGALFVHGDEAVGDLTCRNLDLRDANGKAINNFLKGTDFWLFPGWNQVHLHGADSVYVDTIFHFSHF